MFGISNINTYISIRLTQLGYSSFIAGVIQASYYTGMIIGALFLEKLIHQKGHIRAFSICAGACSAILLVQSFSNSPWLWLLCRFIAGYCVAGFFIIIESWLLLLASETTRGRILSIYMIVLYTAVSIGQYGIGLVPIDSVMPFNLTVIFCAASIIPVCLMKAASPTLTEPKYLNIFYLFKKTPLGFLGILVSGLQLGAFYAIGPIFAQISGYSILQISAVMAVTIFGGMVLQWPVGKLSDIYPRRGIIILICLAILVLSILIVVFPANYFALTLVLLFFFGGFMFTLYPICITFCCDFFSHSNITTVTAAALLIYGIGSIIGPISSPPFLYFIGPKGFFVYMGVLSLLLALFAIYRQTTAPPPPEELKEPYQIHPGLTGNISEKE